MSDLVAIALALLEDLQQHLHLKESNLKFLHHLGPFCLRDVGEVKPRAFIIEVCEPHLRAENTRHVYRFSSGKSRKT